MLNVSGTRHASQGKRIWKLSCENFFQVRVVPPGHGRHLWFHAIPHPGSCGYPDDP